MFNQENIINQRSVRSHDVSKYEFKTVVLADKQDGNMETDGGEAGADSIPQAPLMAALEKELIDTLLQKTDELSSSLAKLQLQFEKLQTESEERIAAAKDEAYKDGYTQAKDDIKKELEDEINAQKKIIVDSIITLENTQKDAQKHIQELEKELSGIAVDIAKEVVVKEIEDNSQKVALALTKELLASIIDATNITIKVNPQDYLYLKEEIKKIQSNDLQKVNIISDHAVAMGGVVIMSNQGNIDGNILTRYKNMKQSVLENMRDE